jgi:hypothetical protein
MKTNEILYPFDESLCGRIAQVVGESSAAALALDELARRRGRGEDAALFIASSTLVVGPPFNAPERDAETVQDLS